MKKPNNHHTRQADKHLQSYIPKPGKYGANWWGSYSDDVRKEDKRKPKKRK